MLNLCSEELFEKVLELDDRLGKAGYGMPNYYQLLGVNLDCSKIELDKNYQDINRIINDHSDYFLEEEIEIIREAYKCFTSLLGAAWYEHKIGINGAHNTRILYDNDKMFQNMFNTLKLNKGRELTIDYLERENNEFIEKKVKGTLKSVVSYDSILLDQINSNGLEGITYKLDFLGKETAIIRIYDENGKNVYVNPYLIDSDKKAMYSVDNVDSFRVVCYNFYMAKKIDVIENAKTKQGNAYIKKI